MRSTLQEREMSTHFLPAWLCNEDVAAIAQWFILAEQENYRYILHPRNDVEEYAIIDVATDQYVEVKPKHIWSSPSMSAAIQFAGALNRKTKKPPREELALSQKIRYINDRKTLHDTTIRPNPFHQCDQCGNNVRDGHTC
jgi:hypothetical protein